MLLNEFPDGLGKTVRCFNLFPFVLYFNIINVQNFSRCFFFFLSFSSPAGILCFYPRRKILLFFFSLTGNFFKGRPAKSSPSSPNEIQPKIKIGKTPKLTLHLRHRQRRPKITNSGDQQKGPKKGAKIIIKEHQKSP
jgi:hypothetical protein